MPIKLLGIVTGGTDYEVQAFQDGKSIGKGVHSRFVVDAEKFLAKTYKK